MAKAATATNTALVSTEPVTSMTSKPNSVAIPQENQFDAFEEFAGGGMEKLTAKDILIPRLGIIQALSDQKKKSNANYVEGCDIGDIIDTATNEIMPRPLEFVPVVFDKVWIEWAPRTTRKGLVAIHTTDEVLAHTKPNDKGQPFLANGNYIAETVQIYGINLLLRRPCFISFYSVFLKKARRWMTLAQGERLERRDGSEYVPPLFYRCYTLDTVTESNTEGEWANWSIERSISLPEVPKFDRIMKQCIDFRNQIAAGIARGDVTNMTDDPTSPIIDATAEPASHNDQNARM